MCVSGLGICFANTLVFALAFVRCDRRFKARRLEGSKHSPDKRSARRLFVFLFIIVCAFERYESVCVSTHMHMYGYHAHMCIFESETYRLPLLVAYVTQSFMGVPATRRGRSSSRAQIEWEGGVGVGQ